MEIKSLEELRRPDDRTLHFTPLGLGGKMRPEDAAVFQQEVISHAALAPVVAKRTRSTFDRLRELYAYGVLNYDIFTIVEDQAHLVLEHALRERFLAFHDGAVPMEDVGGRPHAIQADRVEELFKEIRKASRLPGPRRCRLRLRRTGQLIDFDGMLDSLLRWARGEGLLRGQRNRKLEPLLKSFRDHVAHGAGDHLIMPVDAARTLSDLAEVINQLWGSPTPGGRLYPAPIAREIQAVAWGPDGTTLSGLASNFPAPQASIDWPHVLVRAALHDEGLLHFDALYEVTTYPCELLWGPGSWADAAAWLKEHQPPGDEVEILDRLFVIQYHENRIYLPRNPDVAAGLAAEEQQGTWYLIRADSPTEAFGHTRRAVAGGSPCAEQGHCAQCAVEALGTGTWEEIMDLVTLSGLAMTPHRPPDTRTTSGMRWPRYNE